MTPATPIQTRQIKAAEQAVWDALIAGDAGADLATTAPGFLGVYPDGTATREDHAAQLDDGPSMAEVALHDVVVRRVGDAHCMIVYRAAYRRHGATAIEQMWVSTLWRESDDGWTAVFSQDTPVADVS